MLEKAKAAHQNRVEDRARKKAERAEQRRLAEEARLQRLEEERLRRVEEARLRKEAEEQRIQKRREELFAMDMKELIVENTIILEELTKKMSEVYEVAEHLKNGPQTSYDEEGELIEEEDIYLTSLIDSLYDNISDVRDTVWEAARDDV